MKKQGTRSRPGKTERESRYHLIAARDGERCIICGAHPPAIRLEQDHWNNDSSDDRLENIRLLCHPCNCLKNPRGRSPYLVENEGEKKSCERERARARARARADVQEVKKTGIQEQSVEMEKNSVCECPFRRWIFKVVMEEKSISMEDALYGGAEFVSIAEITAKRYLRKMLSRQGILTFELDESNEKVIVLKEEFAITPPPAANAQQAK